MLFELASSTRRNGHTYMPWAELQNATLYMLQQTGVPLHVTTATEVMRMSNNSVLDL